ncbi:hypothetical protein QYE76_033621 [Lolium multiflorum]|uniref:Reverse transcriptase domain-containing protein n=1 Tax=Lolium multiflorum TaxID=4521 RepID=A0AAD8VMJ1_LOLMU|nr:hypothetical protein QYE76_033621 [Lolium multiflorum]
MLNCNPAPTPVDTKAKLSASDGSLASDAPFYRSIVGALQYLTLTRPELQYAVQQVCLHMHAPRDAHWAAVKRILRYVCGTMGYGLSLHASPSTSTDLVAYSDADWAGCPDTRRSTSGYCVYLGSSLVSWSSKRQPTVSRSSAEAEYRAVANAVAECTWLRQLLSELSCPVDKATVVFCDNVSAVYLSANPVHHRRTKHIELDIHFVRPDGFGPAFFKIFWDTVRSDIVAFLDEFHRGDSHLPGINQAYIVLLPKTENVVTAEGFRQISLQNCLMKIVTRILTSRLQRFIEQLVASEQSGLIAGPCITDNFLYAAELVQCCRLRKTPTIALKLDFRKAFDCQLEHVRCDSGVRTPEVLVPSSDHGSVIFSKLGSLQSS